MLMQKFFDYLENVSGAALDWARVVAGLCVALDGRGRPSLDGWSPVARGALNLDFCAARFQP
jgi:hypothetical protein